MCLDGSSVKLEEVEEIPKETEGIVDIEVADSNVASVTLNENGCEIIGKTIGNTDVKFKCRDVETNVNIDVNEKSVYENVDIGQYVDIGVYYDTPEAVTFTPGRTVTDKPLTGWRVLSKDDDKQTVKLISAGCPISDYLDEQNLPKIYENNNFDYTQDREILESELGFKDIIRDGWNVNIGNYLKEKCEFYDSTEGVHGFCSKNDRGNVASLNDQGWCEDDLGEFLKSVGIEDKVTMTLMSSTKIDNQSLMELCDESVWKEHYNDLIDCGEDYWLGGAFFAFSRNYIGFLVEKGMVTYKIGGNVPTGHFVERGIRLVIELKPDVQILDVDGEDGSSEENAYSLFLSE